MGAAISSVSGSGSQTGATTGLITFLHSISTGLDSGTPVRTGSVFTFSEKNGTPISELGMIL